MLETDALDESNMLGLDTVASSLQAGIEVRHRTIGSLIPQIAAAAGLLVETLQRGGKVLVCGNGGSAASAQHLAGELVGRYKVDRAPLPAVELTADSSVVSCIGNDYGFEDVFARQVQALTRKEDLVIAFTTSGRSSNVLRALVKARGLGVPTLALTGESGLAEPVADHVIVVPSSVTAHVQEEHDAIIHAWCEVIDRAFAPSPPAG